MPTPTYIFEGETESAHFSNWRKSLGFSDKDALPNDCKFCAIIRDKNNAVTTIYPGRWDKEVLVLQPIDPAAEGHILVIPHDHILGSRPAEIFGKTCYWASIVAETLYSDQHVNFQLNQGKDADQKMEHAHVHIVPRQPKDGLAQFFTGQIPGHYNTAGKPKHPEHVKPKYLRNADGKT